MSNPVRGRQAALAYASLALIAIANLESPIRAAESLVIRLFRTDGGANSIAAGEDRSSGVTSGHAVDQVKVLPSTSSSASAISGPIRSANAAVIGVSG